MLILSLSYVFNYVLLFVNHLEAFCAKLLGSYILKGHIEKVTYSNPDVRFGYIDLREQRDKGTEVRFGLRLWRL